MIENKKLKKIFSKYNIEINGKEPIVDEELIKQYNELVYSGRELPNDVNKEIVRKAIFQESLNIPSDSPEVYESTGVKATSDEINKLKEIYPDLEYYYISDNEYNVSQSIKVYNVYSYYKIYEKTLEEIELEFRLKNETKKANSLESIADTLTFFKILTIIGLLLLLLVGIIIIVSIYG